MGLEWKTTGIEDHENVCWVPSETPGRGYLRPVTESLIWLTYSVEVSDNGRITPELLPEFYARVHAWERGRGVSVRVPNDDGGLDDRPITWADVVNHCGLYTNVFPAIGRRAFVTKLIKAMRDGWMSTPDTRPVREIRADIEGWMTEALEDARQGMRSALAQ